MSLKLPSPSALGPPRGTAPAKVPPGPPDLRTLILSLLEGPAVSWAQLQVEPGYEGPPGVTSHLVNLGGEAPCPS